MILVFSKSSLEPTTEEVMDWIESFGSEVLRINGEDLDGGSDLLIRLSNTGTEIRLEQEDISLNVSQIRAVWWRRWLNERQHERVDFIPVENHGGHGAQYEIKKHLNFESRKLEQFFFSRLGGSAWLSDPASSSPNKLGVLDMAARVGLAIPLTIVATRKSEVERLIAEAGRVVVKPIGEADSFVFNDLVYLMFTSVLADSDVSRLPDRFRASLFQECLSKEYEIRIFYLTGEFYAMAIFSQGDEQTRDDFRRYNRERPNRCVPYRLREDTAQAARKLMDSLGLETGSIDLVRTLDGRDVFLEVNPVGQFGMVSKPCNYLLEKKVAEVMMSKGR